MLKNPNVDRLKLESHLLNYLSQKVALKPENISKELSFYHYGLTSIQLVDLSEFLSDKIGYRLSPTIAWEYPTILELLSYIYNENKEDITKNAAASSNHLTDEIAIIGMSCRFPGAPNLEAFWNLCWNGIDAITEVPMDLRIY